MNVQGKEYKIKLSIHQFYCLLSTPRKLVIFARNKVHNVKTICKGYSFSFSKLQYISECDAQILS